MIDEKILAKVFRAASKGVMEPYIPPPMPPGVSGFTTGFSFDGRSYDAAKSLACAFYAIADVFEKLGEAADQSDKKD